MAHNTKTLENQPVTAEELVEYTRLELLGVANTGDDLIAYARLLTMLRVESKEDEQAMLLHANDLLRHVVRQYDRLEALRIMLLTDEQKAFQPDPDRVAA